MNHRNSYHLTNFHVTMNITMFLRKQNKTSGTHMKRDYISAQNINFRLDSPTGNNLYEYY